MIRPDFRDYRNHDEELMHSAKGSTWGKHKYVAKKIINGRIRYIYTIKDAALGSKGSTKSESSLVITKEKEKQREERFKAARDAYAEALDAYRKAEAQAESAKTIEEMAIAATNLKKARSEVVKTSKMYEAAKKVKSKTKSLTVKREIRKYDAQKLTSNIGR